MSSSNIPGVDAMQDSLEFIKKMWGGLGVPGMVVPTLSVEEINKKITDLKAVESWLSLNLNMLRTTIQALEVQSATISALQAMGAVNQAGGEHQGSAESAASAWAMPSGFPFSFMNPSQNADAPAAAPETPKWHETVKQATAPAPENEAENEAAGADAAATGSANAWWDLLQNQFKQAVNSVAATEKAIRPAATTTRKSGAGAKPRTKAAPKPAVKNAGSGAGRKSASGSGKGKTVPK
ncbi:PhaM family polyhydroxyalkanoate granule multifunctional regulatory protein [Collimonas antrihumi]|uniref:PhaM family polyhydroxyalkanoate granule multifunctional regulatory protein n=1 Tax=Collimonas antrihumi TaxID=1940615 RepID=UPI001B8B3423|nr:PhaM family polyhydroxyalkanoate granule multifunctional regulatory protein [Collimonas antrihumi]